MTASVPATTALAVNLLDAPTLWQTAGGLVWTVGRVPAGYGLGSSIPNVDRCLLPIVALIAVVSLLPLLLASRRPGVLALVAAVLMAASRARVGAQHPQDALAGFLVGTFAACLAGLAIRRHRAALAERLKTTALRPLVTAT